MSLATEDLTKNLNIQGIEICFTSIREELKKLLQSEIDQNAKDEITENFSSIQESIKKIKAAETSREQLNLIEEVRNRSRNLKFKYTEVMVYELSKQLEIFDFQVEALKQIILCSALIQASESSQNEIEQIQINKGINYLLHILEEYSHYIDPTVLQLFKRFSEIIIATKNYQPYRESETEDVDAVLNYARTIRNTAKAILWEIDKIEKKNEEAKDFSRIGKLIKYIEISPTWVGDDFEKCLEDLNRHRP